MKRLLILFVTVLAITGCQAQRDPGAAAIGDIPAATITFAPVPDPTEQPTPWVKPPLMPRAIPGEVPVQLLRKSLTEFARCEEDLWDLGIEAEGDAPVPFVYCKTRFAEIRVYGERMDAPIRRVILSVYVPFEEGTVGRYDIMDLVHAIGNAPWAGVSSDSLSPFWNWWKGYVDEEGPDRAEISPGVVARGYVGPQGEWVFVMEAE